MLPPTLCELQAAQWGDAARLLALAMRDNPTHRAVFGASASRRQQRLQRFFEAVLPWVATRGTLIGAWDGDALVGVMGMLRPGSCQPSWHQMLRMGLPLVVSGVAPCLPRVGRWQQAWRQRDPSEPHWHLGPLGVHPVHQGQGLGSRLFGECCRRVDDQAAVAWLETDLPRNVALYRRFGFEVQAEATLMGAANWFMKRAAVMRRDGTGT